MPLDLHGSSEMARREFIARGSMLGALLPIATAREAVSGVAEEDAINVRAAGAVGDGIADDTAAFQSALNRATAQKLPRRVFIPTGEYRITRPLVVERANGLTVFGAGPRSSVLLAGARTAFDMWVIGGSRDCHFERFGVASSADHPIATAFAIETRPGHVSSNCVFRFLMVEGSARGSLGKAFVTRQGSGGDTNSDNHLFEHCIVYDHDVAAWSFEMGQSHGHLLVGCHFVGNPAFSKFGVNTSAEDAGGVGEIGGAFTWIGGLGEGSHICDFNLGNTNGFLRRLRRENRKLRAPAKNQGTIRRSLAGNAAQRCVGGDQPGSG